MTLKFLILADPVPGGEWISTIRLLTKIKQKHPKFVFDLISLNNEILSEVDIFNHIYNLKTPQFAKPFSFLKLVLNQIKITSKMIRSLYLNNKYDFIISANFIMMFSAILQMNLKLKKIFLFHGIKSVPLNNLKLLNRRQLLLKIIETLTLNFSDYIVSPSTFGSVVIKDKLILFGFLKSVFVIPNFIPEIFFNSSTQLQLQSFAKKMSIKPQSKVVLYAGRITYFKGLESLVKAFISFAKYSPNAQLIIASPSNGLNKEIFEYIQKYSSKLKPNQHKILLDLNIIDLHKLYQISDILILPSESEVAPLSVIEAMASGTPFIGTNTGNMKELLLDMNNNLLLHNNSVQEIGKSLKYFFSLNNNERETLSIKSKSIAKSFTADRSIKIFEEKFLEGYLSNSK